MEEIQAWKIPKKILIQELKLKKTGTLTRPKGFLHQVKNVLDRQQPYKDWTAFILFVIKMTLDFLFLYIFVIQDDKKCIELDQNLGITVSVLSMVFDLCFIIYHIMALYIDLDKYASKRLWLSFFFLTDVMACLPIRQARIPLVLSSLLSLHIVIKFTGLNESE